MTYGVTRYEEVQQLLPQSPRRWLITGVAGFIGSNLLEALLKLDQQVVGLDNFATGYARNLDQVSEAVGAQAPGATSPASKATSEISRTAGAPALDVDHRTASCGLGFSAPLDRGPLATHEVNVTGFVNMLVAAPRRQGQALRLRRVEFYLR